MADRRKTKRKKKIALAGFSAGRSLRAVSRLLDWNFMASLSLIFIPPLARRYFAFTTFFPSFILSIRSFFGRNVGHREKSSWKRGVWWEKNSWLHRASNETCCAVGRKFRHWKTRCVYYQHEQKKIKFRSLGLCWLNARLLLRIIINSDLLIATEKRDDGEYNPMDRMYSSDSRSNSINGDDQSIKFWVLAKKIIFLRLFRQHIIFQKIKIRRVDILQIIHKTSIYCMRGMVNIKCLWISARGFFIAGSSDDSLKVSFNWLTLIAFLKNWM